MDLIEEIEKEFGRSITAKELAKILRIHPRTVNQYAHLWGGIKVTSTHYRFFEKQIFEVLKHADYRNQEGQAPLSGKGHGGQSSPFEAISGRKYPVKKIRRKMGVRYQKGIGTRVDGHGLFVDSRLDE